MKLYLFGSRARGDHRPDSDFDVFAIDAPDSLYDALEPYAVEHGGNLDLFSFAGDCLWAAYDEERRVILDKWRQADIAKECKEITIEELIGDPALRWGKDFPRRRNNARST
ncbi:unnamed protein product [marine sediment metagenome]|uniref:Polymerase nucleotidyl transferase domain-containing protein n=1 Tax=marine sediment metagenome TaxID=412755 RepID=X0XIA4_9ZZZZ